MKALVMTLVFAATGMVNMVAGNIDGNFAYNTETENGQVKSQTVYKVEDGKYLKPHLKYNFTYDAENLLMQKEVLKWDVINSVYQRSYCLNYHHTDSETGIELALWNDTENTYSDVKEKTVYQTGDWGMNYLSYEWDEQTEAWNLQAEHLILNGEEVQLLAENDK